MTKHFSFFSGFLVLLFFWGIVHGNEILVNTQEGNLYVLSIDEDESLQMLTDKLATLTESEDFLIEISARGRPKNFALNASRNQGGYLGYPRNYFADLTHDEVSVIRYIVTTLANKSVIAIALAKNEIEEAGDSIDHLHPLRFVMAIFTDEEMKVGIRNIRQRGWLWNQFTAGLKGSLTTETSIGNMKKEHILHFCQVLNIQIGLIENSLQQQNWDEFIDILITQIPRTGDHDRYDT